MMTVQREYKPKAETTNKEVVHPVRPMFFHGPTQFLCTVCLVGYGSTILKYMLYKYHIHSYNSISCYRKDFQCPRKIECHSTSEDFAMRIV